MKYNRLIRDQEPVRGLTLNYQINRSNPYLRPVDVVGLNLWQSCLMRYSKTQNQTLAQYAKRLKMKYSSQRQSSLKKLRILRVLTYKRSIYPLFRIDDPHTVEK